MTALLDVDGRLEPALHGSRRTEPSRSGQSSAAGAGRLRWVSRSTTTTGVPPQCAPRPAARTCIAAASRPSARARADGRPRCYGRTAPADRVERGAPARSSAHHPRRAPPVPTACTCRRQLPIPGRSRLAAAGDRAACQTRRVLVRLCRTIEPSGCTAFRRAPSRRLERERGLGPVDRRLPRRARPLDYGLVGDLGLIKLLRPRAAGRGLGDGRAARTVRRVGRLASTYLLTGFARAATRERAARRLGRLRPWRSGESRSSAAGARRGAASACSAGWRDIVVTSCREDRSDSERHGVGRPRRTPT